MESMVRFKGFILSFLIFSFSNYSFSKFETFVDLFAAGDFSEWTHLNGAPVQLGWSIREGVVCRHAIGGDIITKKTFKDFELSFEWKISKSGNSGVKYRTRGRLGLEYQVLDDLNHHDNKKPSHRASSLYELVAAPADKPLKSVGQWNQARILAKGKSIQHFLNGEKVVEIEWGTNQWKKRFGQSKYKKHQGFGNWEGPILLQDHMDVVWFRNLKIRRL